MIFTAYIFVRPISTDVGKSAAPHLALASSFAPRHTVAPVPFPPISAPVKQVAVETRLTIVRFRVWALGAIHPRRTLSLVAQPRLTVRALFTVVARRGPYLAVKLARPLFFLSVDDEILLLQAGGASAARNLAPTPSTSRWASCVEYIRRIFVVVLDQGANGAGGKAVKPARSRQICESRVCCRRATIARMDVFSRNPLALGSIQQDAPVNVEIYNLAACKFPKVR